MASWSKVEDQAPELATRARTIFDAFTHKTIATLRRDGSPRISGTEVEFEEGEMWIGSMWRSVKALDLQRDGRFALHSGSTDPPDWAADAKVAGRAIEVTSRTRPPIASASTSPSWSSRASATPPTTSSSSPGTRGEG